MKPATSGLDKEAASGDRERVNSPAPVGPSPLEAVLLVERMGPREAGFAFTASSLPGHLIHFILSGHVRQECNGRSYDLRPGQVIWYHEDEWVTGTVEEGPWLFYSVNFITPALPPPGFEARQIIPHDPPALSALFARLLSAWKGAACASREYRVQAALLEILATLSGARPAATVKPGSQLWWEIETRARTCLHEPLTLAELARWSRRSPATLTRAACEAVGMPPLQRLRAIRMSLARGLVRSSRMTMNEIAGRIGYQRVHEFSRAYRRHFGLSPTAERKAAAPAGEPTA